MPLQCRLGIWVTMNATASSIACSIAVPTFVFLKPPMSPLQLRSVNPTDSPLLLTFPSTFLEATTWPVVESTT